MTNQAKFADLPVWTVFKRSPANLKVGDWTTYIKTDCLRNGAVPIFGNTTKTFNPDEMVHLISLPLAETKKSGVSDSVALGALERNRFFVIVNEYDTVYLKTGQLRLTFPISSGEEE